MWIQFIESFYSWQCYWNRHDGACRVRSVVRCVRLVMEAVIRNCVVLVETCARTTTHKESLHQWGIYCSMHKLVYAFVVIIANCFLRSALYKVVFSVNKLCSTWIVFSRDHYVEFSYLPQLARHEKSLACDWIIEPLIYTKLWTTIL